jgi:hypothetical protein
MGAWAGLPGFYWTSELRSSITHLTDSLTHSHSHSLSLIHSLTLTSAGTKIKASVDEAKVSPVDRCCSSE